MPRLRALPEDFQVDEVPLYPASGEGDHTFVHVEKRLRTTEEVARALARAAQVAPREVGYAGRKDRRGVTRQWFSVPGLAPERALELSWPGVQVLTAARHRHKLRTGQLRGNRFRIVVREVGADDCRDAEAALSRLCRTGLPNRYGVQRFGTDGRNADRARHLLAGNGAVGNRREARFLVSALQSAVFNRVLAERGAEFDRVRAGDVAVVHASGGLFVVDDPALEAPRAATFEISPTGPIFGTRVIAPQGATAETEARALAEFGIDPENLRPPRGIRLRGGRRPLRVHLERVAVERIDHELRLEFTLPAGSYASVLLEEILGGGKGLDDSIAGGGVSSARQEGGLP